MNRLPKSPHYTLHELGEGIYAAIHKPGGWAVCNAGIIDLGDRTLIFDAFLSPKACKDLLAAAQTLTGRPADSVLLSHYHNDHTWGNLAVPGDTELVSTEKTRDLLAGRETKEDQEYHQQAAQRLADLQAQVERASSESEKSQAQFFVAYTQAILDTLPMLPARVPNSVFREGLEFAGSKRRARFLAYGGHTASDAILHLPEDQILFLGDLLFVESHPYFADGNPDELCQTVAKIKELRANVLVPGHGPLGRMEDLDAMLEYLNEMQMLVRQAIRAGDRWEELAGRRRPASHPAWNFPTFYEENLQFLYGQLSKAGEAKDGDVGG